MVYWVIRLTLPFNSPKKHYLSEAILMVNICSLMCILSHESISLSDKAKDTHELLQKAAVQCLTCLRW